MWGSPVVLADVLGFLGCTYSLHSGPACKCWQSKLRLQLFKFTMQTSDSLVKNVGEIPLFASVRNIIRGHPLLLYTFLTSLLVICKLRLTVTGCTWGFRAVLMCVSIPDIFISPSFHGFAFKSRAVDDET